MPKWLEVAERSLGPDDTVIKSWTGRVDEERGHIVLSKKKMLLVEEHGFIHQTADVNQEIPYETIAKIRTENPNQLALTTSDRGEHRITSPYLSTLERTTENLIKQVKSKA
jgi:hypothetical protein